jgi:hypothetical protein
VWDRLSLLVCMAPVNDQTMRTLPPIATADGDVNIEARANSAGELILEPFPFGSDSIEFSVAMSVTDSKRWPDTAEFRRDFRAAPRAVFQFTCRPAG